MDQYTIGREKQNKIVHQVNKKILDEILVSLFYYFVNPFLDDMRKDSFTNLGIYIQMAESMKSVFKMKL